MASSQATKRTSGGNGKTNNRNSQASKQSSTRKNATSSSAKTTSKRRTGTNNRTQSTKRASTSAKRNSGRGGYTKEEYIRRSGMYDEVKMIIALLASVIMLISTLNFGGRVGGFVSSFLFGVFGWVAYLVPYVVFFGTAFLISNKNNRVKNKKIVAFICFFVFLLAFLQMLTSSFDATTKITDYYRNSSIYKNGGGVIGGTVCYFLTPLFGRLGCYVIIIIGMLLGIVFMAQRAVFTMLLKQIRSLVTEIRENNAERRRIREEIMRETYNEDAVDEDDFDEQGDIPVKSRKERSSVHKKDPEPIQNIVAEVPEARTVSTNNETKPFEFDFENFKLEDVFIEEPKEEVKTQDITVTRMEPIQFMDTTDHTQSNTSILQGISDATMPLPQSSEIEKAIEAMEAKAEKPEIVSLYDGDEEAVSEIPDETEQSDAELIADTANDTVQGTNKPQKLTPKDTEAVTADEIAEPVKEYIFPPVSLLKKGKNTAATVSDKDLRETALKLQNTLDSFGVKVQVTNVSCGPSVTRYELTPDQGVKVSKIVALTDDIKLNLAVSDIRIEAPIPGKSAVGIEVPNKENTVVLFRDLIESAEFQKSGSNVSFAVGRDIGGQVIVTDIAKMPHLLIAGATGSGKSVCINTLIMSIIYKAKPDDVRLIMVDPKVVELSVYNGIPHLLIPVVTDPKKAAGALNWAVMEMTDRYNKFAELGVREIKGYNEKIKNSEYDSETYKKMPQIVIIVDELADLMMVASSEVEDAICRLAQLARAAGIHLVIATQRPSVNVITGLIKANIPSRVAFAVSSGVDSRTIIDMVGAEKLLGKGDMLFYPAGMQKPLRVQGAFISDKEVNDVVDFLNEQGETAVYNDEVAGKINTARSMDSPNRADERDVYFVDAGRFIIEKDKASIGMLQRVYKIGFNRAARIMDQLCEAGVVGPEEGTKPRKVLMSAEQFETFVEETV